MKNIHTIIALTTSFCNCLYLSTLLRWRLGMLPKCMLSIKGRTCYQTLLVHQYMTKKTTFNEKN